MDDPIRAIEFLKQLEKKNDEILRDNHKVLKLDVERNEAREALRALDKSEKDKTFMFLGPMMIKLTKTEAQDILKNDCRRADVEINKIRSDLKVKVNELKDMKRQPGIPGLFLKPVNETELQAFGARK